ncbi:MarR family transcriptional regulator [Kitasatospora sp. NPDC049285]|uniref:MarR family winged helix-turn-helix transcriptional regulator n=1 Tax=Kitasatospora sp. NPDC049285 TaxID=3157096 RepID=UPI00344174A1
MQTEDPLAGAELTFLLGMAFQLLHAEFVGRVNTLTSTELRPVHGMLFQILGQDGATNTELATKLGVTKQATGQIIDFLEERGYVERLPHPDGGRRKLVVMTDSARLHLAVAGHVLADLEGKLAADLGAADMAELRRELARLIRYFAGDEIPPLRPLW